MDLIFTGSVLGGMGLLGMAAIYKMVSQKYPPVKIEVWDRGFRQLITYRTWGKTIVKNNLFKLLMNEFEVCGTIDMLEFDAVKGLFGFDRVYRAYRRHDFLFPLVQAKTSKLKMKDGTESVVENKSLVPELVAETPDGKAVKVTITKEGMLFPFRLYTANEALQEVEVANIKSIAARIADAIKTTKAYVESTNPLIATLMYSAPLFFIVLAVGIVLYIILQGASDNVLHIVEAQAKMTEQLCRMSGECA